MQKAGKYGHYFGRIEKIFLVLVALYAVLFFTRIASGLGALVAVAAFILGLISCIRLLRMSMRTAIWRLRNRLVVAYLFIAVVPIVLGRGERLWDGFEGIEQRFNVETVSSPSGVAHVTFTRR